MKESTRNIIKMHGWRIDRIIHNYIYFVYYDLYVKFFLKAGRLAREKYTDLKASAAASSLVFNEYHAKVLTYDDAKKILSLKSDLNLGPDYTKRIVPFQYANKIILEEPEYIAIMDCPCRMSREDPCLPLNVCIAVGRTTAQFWIEHCEKYNARKVDQAEALQIVEDARARGEITTAWFKVATGGRTGVICNCCNCCCGGLEGMRLAQGLKYGKELSNFIPSGYAIDIERDECVSCGECADVCFFDAIKMDGEDVVYDRDACMGCGLCVEKCDQDALTFNTDFEKEYPLDLDFVKEKLG